MSYQSFLEKKGSRPRKTGFFIKESDLSSHLFQFQKKIVTQALNHGKYAIFADCGLGKTLMQLEWAKHVCEETEGNVLILAPLAVSMQTKHEGDKFGILVNVARDASEVKDGITITNYEMMHHFDLSIFQGIVLDESSILKNFMGKVRNAIIEGCRDIPYKLACTATPSPNDFVELGNHCDFLDVLSMNEMLAMYFINDVMGKKDMGSEGWRIKGHAEDDFWKFVGSWACMIQKPSDVGCDDGDFALPELRIHKHILKVDSDHPDTLFQVEANTLTERREARKTSLEDRVGKTMEIIDKVKGQTMIWCDFNNESELLSEVIEGSVEVKGSDTPKHKEDSMIGFAEGRVKTLVSKPSICGFGMNFQSCNTMIFCGLSDSYEQYYQAIRRCWRFGQKNIVDVHVILSEREITVLENIERKHKNHDKMFSALVKNVSSHFSTPSFHMAYKEHKIAGIDYTIYLGDCVENVERMADESIDYSIFSPPFASLYTYSSSERDMGNCKNPTEFYAHFKFLIDQLYRVTKSGRLLSFHCMNIPTSKMRDGHIGLSDFRGDLIRMFQDAGWWYHSEVCIWKDPVVAMQRTKALGLLHKQIKKDSSMSRQGIPDYLVTMRKPGVNPEPIAHTPEEFPVDEWQKIASPVWMDIRQGNTLQKESAREDKDEKHICPLQLDVIERALYLWSNPNDLVLSPFMGIGSEGYCSIRLGRRFIGVELKESYFKQAERNLLNAEEQKKQITLF